MGLEHLEMNLSEVGERPFLVQQQMDLFFLFSQKAKVSVEWSDMAQTEFCQLFLERREEMEKSSRACCHRGWNPYRAHSSLMEFPVPVLPRWETHLGKSNQQFSLNQSLINFNRVYAVCQT